MSKTTQTKKESLRLEVKRRMAVPTSDLFRAWTGQFDRWFAVPGTVRMKPEVGSPFYFATEMDGRQHAHYGRFLRLDPDKLVELTWVTGDPGTRGAETVVTVKFEPKGKETEVVLTHEGFSDEETRKGHADAWPMVLEQQEKKLASGR